MPLRHDPVRTPANGQPWGGASSRVLREQRGFVLVAVLLLIALATVLIVTTSSVSQIERKAVSNSAKQEIARQNALFALGVAIAQIQSAAGPDQRVTATADILSGEGTLKQPYWTGVWKTGTNALDVGVGSSTPQRTTSLGGLNPTANQKAISASWLVSGAQNSTTINPIAWTDSSSGLTNSVALALNYGTKSATVRVPLVVMTNTYSMGTTKTNLGGYAYWVSDEGVKAKVNMNDPTLKTFGTGVSATDNLAKNLLHFVAPQAAAIYKGSDQFGTSDLRADTNKLPKVTTLQSLANVVSGFSGTNASQIAADFTTASWGVIADVRKGGLKRDLTAAFEDNGNTPGKNYNLLNPDGTARVYQARSGDSSDTIPSVSSTSLLGLDGLRWINLYFHYNLYKSALPSVNLSGRTGNGTNAPSGVGSPDSSRPYTVSPRGLGWTESSFGSSVNYGILSPVFLGLRWDVTFNSQEITPGQYNLFLNYYPQFVLYNPYSVRIRSSANNFRFARALASLSSLYLQVSVPVTSSSGGTPTTITNYYHAALNLGTTVQRLVYNTSFDDTQTFEPGEIRVYGMSNNVLSALKSPTNNPIPVASEFIFTNAPYGLVSTDFAANRHKLAKFQAISVINPLEPNNPLADTYSDIPNIPSNTPITISLTTRPSVVGSYASSASVNFSASGSSDVSISSGVFWPTIGGEAGGAIIKGVTNIPGSDTRRTFVAGAPSAASTGGSAGGVTPGITRPNLTNNVEALTGETQVFSFFTRKKGINKTGGSIFNNSQIAVPWFSGNSILFNLSNDSFGARWWDEVCIKDLNSWPAYPPMSAETITTTITSENYTTTSWGDVSTGVTPPTPKIGSRIVLFDVPVQPMVSLGQFMHIKPAYSFTTGDYKSMGFGNMFIGGSLPSPEVPLNQTVMDNTTVNYRTLIMDHSFLANQALFDSYFFSTVPPAGSPPSGTTWPESWTLFNSANPGTTLSDASIPMLNSRIKPYLKGGTNLPVMADLRDMNKAAANLVLDGAFNINSTSVPAWKAFLSSTSGNDLDMWDAGTGTSKTFSSSDLKTPFVRFSGANSNGKVNDLWSGIRSLSDTEISDLATKIVAEVKLRGPFLSMADFLNRRLGESASDLTRAGALQAAIDKTTLNNNMKSAGVNISVPTYAPNNSQIPPLLQNMCDATGAIWKTTIGAPGYLMQQDLVQALSPAMTVRSDTFVIRVYGDARNSKTGAIEGIAYAEAVVQRTPEFMDQSDGGLTGGQALGDATPISNLTSKTNISLGRRFKIVSFRWLNSNEI